MKEAGNKKEKEKEEKEAGNKKEERGGENQRGGRGRWKQGDSERGERESEQEGRERGGGADMAATQKRRKRGRRDGRGERRVSALPKKWKGCVHQAMSEQEEHEGVKRGATGGQRAGGKQVWRASCTGELQANCETERGRGDERKQCVV